MAYIAIHYVNLNGTVYMPGEAIDQDMEAAQAERLLEKGAIRKKVAPSIAPEAEDDSETGVTPETPEATVEDTEDEAEDEAENDTEEEAEDDTEEDAEDEDEYEDAEPLEIDVADSIVAPAEETAAEDKKPARKRKGGKEKA